MKYEKTVMNKPLEITDIVSIHYFEYAKNFIFSGEFHDFWEFVYADKEDLLITAGAHEILLPTGHLYLHRPMEFHNLRCIGGKAANSVVIAFSSPCKQLFSIAGKVIHCPKNCRKLLAMIITEAKQSFSTPLSKHHTLQLIRSEEQPFGSEQLIQIHLEEFLIRLIRTCGDTQPMQEPILIDDLVNTRLADICQYLEQNVENKLTFSDVCQYSSMSESSLKKLFRDGIGSGAMEYYNLRKIERAKQYIREQEINFTEIADRLGYNSVQYFSLCFKKTTGMTPSQYARSIETMV